MTRGEYYRYKGCNVPKNDNKADDGYLVRYSDKYESWSPKKQFDEAYRECNNLTFGIALELLKQGKKVARSVWNGKGMYLFIAYREDLSSCLFKEELTCCDSICMKTAQETIVVGWLASQTDMLAEDWEIVE